VAKAHDIPLVAAALSARRGLEAGVVAEAFDQVRRIGESGPSMDEGRVHAKRFNPGGVSRLRTSIVNAVLTMFAGRTSDGFCSCAETGMAPLMRTTRAGGCFLTICILGGFAVGLMIRNPMKGVLIGTALGAALAILLWLVDRRR
jgi:hypothetical protein